MKQQTSRSPMVGGTSLITIFAVLCLIVFTLLTKLIILPISVWVQKNSIKTYPKTVC